MMRDRPSASDDGDANDDVREHELLQAVLQDQQQTDRLRQLRADDREDYKFRVEVDVAAHKEVQSANGREWRKNVSVACSWCAVLLVICLLLASPSAEVIALCRPFAVPHALRFLVGGALFAVTGVRWTFRQVVRRARSRHPGQTEQPTASGQTPGTGGAGTDRNLTE